LLKIPNTNKNLTTIIVFDNCNKAIFTKHITNCSFNNNPLGLLMNMTSPSSGGASRRNEVGRTGSLAYGRSMAWAQCHYGRAVSGRSDRHSHVDMED
jgi:hypothetical protein